MTDNEKKKAAKSFAEYWADKGYEKGQSQSFWLSLLRDIFEVEYPEQYVVFEEQVKIDRANGFIDVMIPSTKVMIEQKGANKDLRKGIVQSDGSVLNPFQQAKRYIVDLPLSEHPRWVITCNFKEFLIYDMEKPTGEPESILLKDLPKEYYRLSFLVEEKSELLHREEQISIKAGELVGKLYDAIQKQYIHPDSEESLRSLNMLCVRLVFCLYAEDAGIFGGHLKFHNYIKNCQIKDVRRALIDLFRTLDTKEEERDPYMDESLAVFPYVNGGLFADENIEIPHFTEEIVDLLLHNASEDFDWSQISPTIFGAVFESTLNPETRRSGGMHYTSIENIHKVIDPLFLDELRAELDDIKAIKVDKTRLAKADEFQEKLSKLTFLDPACGSGNFLTETYISLRRLENEVLTMRYKNQIVMDAGDLIKVSIGQFYGIEINDFAVTVAKTALWIAESQMMKETEDIVAMPLDFLPLKSYANIIEGNALRVDWESVVPKDKLNYIMGNPPFVGARLMSKEQKDDLLSVFGDKWKNAGNLDYVSCWYKKAADLMSGTAVRTALVSTNSVSQGESVAVLWKPLFECGVHIDFAHRTFRWDNRGEDSEGNKIKTDKQMAAVHCVIIGFSLAPLNKPKVIYSAERKTIANNINAYLIDAPNIFVESNSISISSAPPIHYGSFALDDGNYTIKSQEYDELARTAPDALVFMRPFIGAQELLHNQRRYCVWLLDVSPATFNKCKPIMEKVHRVKAWREKSNRKTTKELALTPTLFAEIRQPTSNYLAIPTVCSEKRKYIPMAYLDSAVIASNQIYVIENASLYHLGILISNVHMAWVRLVCGRLEMRYRYSAAVVYNNFPWPNPTDEQRAKIEQTAQAILDARALYPDCSLADLYDEVTMPPELRKAHQQNDRAVMQAYGFDVKTMTESSCVAELMRMYRELMEG